MAIKRVIEQQKYQQQGKPSEVYSDFLQSFLPHPTTGNITRRTDVSSVKMALRNLMLTNKYERLKNPDFGTNIRNYLFELASDGTNTVLKDQIEIAIENYEPRVRILDLQVNLNPDQNSVLINLIFSVITNQEPQNLEITLYRVR